QDAMATRMDDAGKTNQQLVPDFLKAGGREVFVVVNVGEIPAAPGFAVFPLASGADAEAIKTLIVGHMPKGPDAPTFVVEEVGGMIYAGSDKWLRKGKVHIDAPPPRRELVAAFEGAGDGLA